MVRLVLWKHLTETDFDAINAHSSPAGTGGGARHIALGVLTPSFRVDSFVLAPGKNEAIVLAEAPAGGMAELHFYSNPTRRNGEWTIRDQYAHRHPAWEPKNGFPTAYDPGNPPVVFVAAVGTRFFARAMDLNSLSAGTAVPPQVLAEQKGIISLSDSFAQFLQVPLEDALDVFQVQEIAAPTPPFNPADLEDGRRQVFAAIMRRQGQASFRKNLFAAYKGRCAITRSSLHWVLEAAHIVPYRGPHTNTLANGLLLRADVHTLFDLGLVAVDPATLRVKASSLLAGSPYSGFDGRPLHVPQTASERPSIAAIAEHFKGFRA